MIAFIGWFSDAGLSSHLQQRHAFCNFTNVRELVMTRDCIAWMQREKCAEFLREEHRSAPPPLFLWLNEWRDPWDWCRRIK